MVDIIDIVGKCAFLLVFSLLVMWESDDGTSLASLQTGSPPTSQSCSFLPSTPEGVIAQHSERMVTSQIYSCEYQSYIFFHCA